MKSLWGGRFTENADDFFTNFNASFPFDYRLVFDDITGSIAWAGALEKAGVLSKEEAVLLIDGLNKLADKIRTDNPWFQKKLASGYEDVHAFVESELGDYAGDVAKKLHTGRSRNDQVATDIRLYMKKMIQRQVVEIKDLCRAMIVCAERYETAILPGYTHLQKAQPIVWGHYVLSWVEMLKRDVSRLENLITRMNKSPLGSGALAGNSHGIDRLWLAEQLGFDGVTHNSLDATSDRDHIVEYLSVAALVMIHLSRLSEDLIIYASQEFNYVSLSDQVSTGSSLMPQKKNPDALELIRGKAGRIMGHQISIQTVLKGLPSCYNKDMQEDKEGLFDAESTLSGSLRVMTTVISTMKINVDIMKEACQSGFLNATDLADYLVSKGISFRESHHIVGEIVVYAVKNHLSLGEIRLDVYQDFSAAISEDVYQSISIETTIQNKDVIGSTSPVRVREALEVEKAYFKKT